MIADEFICAFFRTLSNIFETFLSTKFAGFGLGRTVTSSDEMDESLIWMISKEELEMSAERRFFDEDGVMVRSISS